MSVINQVLYNLEQRSALPAERGVLPAHVRALPEGGHARRWGWVAVGAAFAVAAPAAAWVAFNATVTGPTRTQMASGAAGVSEVAWPDAGDRAYLQEAGVFRLSLELASLSAERAPHRGKSAKQTVAKARGPLSSTRVLDRKDAETAPDASGDEPTATSRSVASAGAPAKPAVKVLATPPEIRKQVRDPTPRQLSEHGYHQAVALLNQDRPAEAEEGFREALRLDPENHQARQALVGLLVQARRLEDAERVLDEGVKLAPAQTGFSVTLARLQAHRGDTARAITTLQSGLEHAKGSAEYAAFLATLLQREGQHEKAIEQFQSALRARPSAGVWWVGLGISLQASNHPAAALDAYRQARATGNLHPHLAALAEQRLRQLQ